jgi:hypothetical protein
MATLRFPSISSSSNSKLFIEQNQQHTPIHSHTGNWTRSPTPASLPLHLPFHPILPSSHLSFHPILPPSHHHIISSFFHHHINSSFHHRISLPSHPSIITSMDHHIITSSHPSIIASFHHRAFPSLPSSPHTANTSAVLDHHAGSNHPRFALLGPRRRCTDTQHDITCPVRTH